MAASTEWGKLFANHVSDKGLLSDSIWAVITKYHRLGSLNNRHLFLTAPEAGKSKMVAPADSVSGEGGLPGSQMAASSCVLTRQEAQKSSRGHLL